MKESNIMRSIQIEARKYGVTLLRNNVGMAYTGVPIAQTPHAITLRNPTAIRFGLGTGSSDLIGWTSTGRFVAVEVKLPGKKPTDDQEKFIQAVLKAGGQAHVMTKIEDVKEAWG